MSKNICLFIAVFLLLACTNISDPTEPSTSVTLIGHFTCEYSPGLNGIAVTLYQEKNMFQTTTDVNGTFTFSTGLTAGPSSIMGIAKSNCCWTTAPVTLHEGVNYIDIPVVFI
jgi:hypothetical protein